MQYPLAGWCHQNLTLYSPNIFFNKFVEEQKPNSLDMLNLGKWLYESFPDRHFDLQNLVWTRLERANLLNDGCLAQEIAYKVFKQRVKKSNLENFQKGVAKGYTVLSHERDPGSQNKLTFRNLSDLVASVFGENGFKAACIQTLNDLPDQDTSVQDVVCTLLNLEIFKRSFSGVYSDVPRSAAALIVGVYQRNDCEYEDAPAENANESRSNFQQMMCNQVINRANHLVVKLNEGPIAKSNKLLINLCLLIKVAFENHDANLLAQPVSELPSLFPKRGTSLSVNLCKNYLQAGRNLVKLVSEEFKGGNPKKLRQFLDTFYWDLGFIGGHYHVTPTLVTIFNDYTKISLLLENLKRDLEKFYSSIDSSHDDHWLYYDRTTDLAAMNGLISESISCFLNHLKNALNESIFLNDSQKTRLLPNAGKLRANLRHLYEKRTVIAGIVDLYRQANEKFKINIKKMSGHSLQKTIAEFLISPNRVKLSNLITNLKVFDNPVTVFSGDFFFNVTALKKAFPDYLESFIEESIGDAEEALETCINFANQIILKGFEQEVHESFKEFNIGIQTIGAFLETAAWLKNYFFVQKPIWECSLIDEIDLKKEPVKKSAGKKAGKNKKKGVKVNKGRGRAVDPFISSLKDDAHVTQQVPVAVQAPLAEKVQAAVKESSSSDDELENAVASASEIWKARVEQLRSMRQMARGLKQMEQVPAQLQEPARTSSVQEVLGGAFRRKLAGELTLLRKSKVSEILKELNNDGWTLNRITGDHHIFSHPCLVGQVVIPYVSESEQLKKGTFNSVAKSAGWMDSARIVTASFEG